MRGVTLDTGALIALERRSQRMRDWRAASLLTRTLVTVPAAVLAEWWRGHGRAGDRILAGMQIEPLSAELAKLAGNAIAAVPRATAVDAIVMASAAQRGDLVYTSDVGDLEALRAYFPDVKVLHV